MKTATTNLLTMPSSPRFPFLLETYTQSMNLSRPRQQRRITRRVSSIWSRPVSSACLNQQAFRSLISCFLVWDLMAMWRHCSQGMVCVMRRRDGWLLLLTLQSRLLRESPSRFRLLTPLRM
ncbi:hypothetical protein DY000_02011372 [Brassica cretica]|uniref:Uncharacterized protein n=1 Tax=Brassica cretica TaxID=69181 RepID=A0ABQ7D226_BRACR|nr:hypothetical protein DY000_02011372 [Brassica cretica]